MNDPTPILQTPRLHLRRWRDSDLATFASINADPRVMEFLRSLLTRAQSDQRVAESEAHFERHGMGKWAVELIAGNVLVGSVGLSVVDFPAPFTSNVEIGWRLTFPTNGGRGDGDSNLLFLCALASWREIS